MTYGTMQARIGNELKRPSLASEIQNAILSALDYYKRFPFRWNAARTTTTTTDGVEYYGLPDDFIEAETMVLRDGNDLDDLEERSHFWIDIEKEWAAHTSRPYVFSVRADQFRLYPTPDDTYTLILTYRYELEKPSADADTSAWFTDGEELIRTHAKVDLLENVIRGPESFQEAEYLRRREEQVRKQLTIEYKRSQSSGKITPWS